MSSLYRMAKEDGAEAFRNGVKAGDCPHTDPVLKEGWEHGWENAFIDAQSSAPQS